MLLFTTLQVGEVESFNGDVKSNSEYAKITPRYEYVSPSID